MLTGQSATINGKVGDELIIESKTKKRTNQEVFMRFLSKKLSLGIISAVLMSVCLYGVSYADIIPYSVIAPHEYQLPIGDDIPNNGTTLLLSYNTYRDMSSGFKGDNLHKQANSLFASVNKLAHIFKIDGVKDVGFLWEAVLGAGNLTMKNGNNLNGGTGLIDAQTGLVAWIKPTKNWVSCLEYWMYIPIGADNLSSHSWNHSFAYMTNVVFGNFTFDGDFGYKINGDSRFAGVKKQNGDVIFANGVWAYKFIKQVEPFFKVDYLYGRDGRNVTTSEKIGSRYELAIGYGNQFYLSDRLSFAAWYEQGIAGRNIEKTKAGYIRAIWAF